MQGWAYDKNYRKRIRLLMKKNLSKLILKQTKT